MSEQQLWSDVDDYFHSFLTSEDDVLEAALRDSDAAGLPRIAVSPSQGRLLQLLAQTQGARRILELGTLGGYSTIWLARALPPDGRLVSLEYEPRHAEVARGNLARAGLDQVAEVHVGPALDSLARLAAGTAADPEAAPGADPFPAFDVVFLDADKQTYPQYLEWALRLTRPGSLIIGDNVVRGGAVADPDSTDPGVQGVRRFLDRMARHPKLSATAVQTVGSKGYDGFSLARVLA
jgi:predicted O-methyltransferase YrrM